MPCVAPFYPPLTGLRLLFGVCCKRGRFIPPSNNPGKSTVDSPVRKRRGVRKTAPTADIVYIMGVDETEANGPTDAQKVSLLERAWACYHLSPHEAALEATRAREQAIACADTDALAECLALLSLLDSQGTAFAQAAATAAQAVGLLSPTTPPDVCAKVWYSRAGAHSAMSEYAPAAALLTKALPMARLTGNDRLIADILADLAQIQHRRGEFISTVETLGESQRRSAAAGYAYGEGIAFNRLGNAYDRLGQCDRALDAHQKSLEIRAAINDKNGVASSLSNLGSIYTQLNQRDEALACYERSLALCRETGNEKLEATVLGNQGLVYQVRGDRETALACQRAALAIKERFGDRQSRANTLSNMGSLLTEMGRFTPAQVCFETVLCLTRAIGDVHGEGLCLLGMAQLYHRWDTAEEGDQMRHDRALALLHTALQHAQATSAPALLMDVHKTLATVYKSHGDFEAALRHHEIFAEVTQSVFTAEMTRTAANLQVLHKVEQTRRELEYQKARTRELDEALARAEAQRGVAEQEARQDSLTRLMTRRYGDIYLTDAFTYSKRNGLPLALAIADIDHFKSINDHHSHHTGDMVLRTVADILRNCCRDTDIIVRWGGEEFVLIAPGTEGDDFFVLCERVRRRIAQHPWENIHPSLTVTVSIGIGSATEADDPRQLMAVADTRLYQAKNSGRNRVQQ